MKISSTSEPLRPDRVSTPGTTAAETRADAAGGAGAARTGGAASVQLSDLASRLSALESQFSTADFDVAKVNDIRDAIANGTFKVDAGVVADKLLASVSDLLGKR